MKSKTVWARPFKAVETGRKHKIHLLTYREDDYAVAACNNNIVLSAIKIDDPFVYQICYKCLRMQQRELKNNG